MQNIVPFIYIKLQNLLWHQNSVCAWKKNPIRDQNLMLKKSLYPGMWERPIEMAYIFLTELKTYSKAFIIKFVFKMAYSFFLLQLHLSPERGFYKFWTNFFHAMTNDELPQNMFYQDSQYKICIGMSSSF